MDDTTFLIVGAKGQLGTALKKQYPNAHTVDSDELDITDNTAVQTFDWTNISTILNAAAITNVDGVETAEGRVLAWKVNATGVRNLTEAAIKYGLTIFHISSDYVFDGTHAPHVEDEPYSPLGIYAQTKTAGDIAVSLAPKHYILRTSWVIGEGKNFVRTMLELGKKGIEPTVVSDQIGRLTFTSELVRAIDHLLQSQPAYGTYNVTNSGEPASWADVTRTIFQLAGYNLQVTDTTTAEYFASKPGVAPRPLQSTLNLNKLTTTGFTARDWREDLAAYIEAEKVKEEQ